MGKRKSSSTHSETPRQDAFTSAWDKFRPLVPPEELAAVESSFTHPLPPAIRINRLKINADEIQLLGEKYHWMMEPVPFCPEGYRIRTCETLPSHTPEHHSGQFYIQDSASMLPPMLFDADRFDHSPLILDLAASPGGKTTHLIDRMGDRGLIFANDSSASRIAALKTVLKNWGTISCSVTNFAGESFGAWFPERFDLVLLDAPCSMQSLVSIDSHPMRPITEREEQALAVRQKALLESALYALKPGGQLVYSTCTLSPDEDEAVVDAMLKKFQGMITIENAQRKLPAPAPGVTEAGSVHFDSTLSKTVRLWPHRFETAGFFAALLSKQASFENLLGTPPQRSWEKSSFTPCPEKTADAFKLWLNDQFDLSLSTMLSSAEAELWMRGEELWMIPSRMTSEFAALPCKTTGMRVASATPFGWNPDNDWINRFLKKLHAREFYVEASMKTRWLSGEDIPISDVHLEKGTIILIMDEQRTYLGSGSVSGSRIRNLQKH